MDKANIIISIIIVLCIAAAVAAYGITNSDNPIFSNLASMGSNDNAGDGIGNITVDNATNISSSNGGSSSSGSGSDSGSNSGSSSSSSGSSGTSSSSSGSSSGRNSNSIISRSTAQSIALSAAPDSSYYVQSSSYSDGVWYVGIGNGTDGYGFEVEINAYTGKIIGGGGGAP